MEFAGAWRLQQCRNFDQFLRACGVPLIMAKLALTLTPTETISCEGDPNTGQWSIKLIFLVLFISKIAKSLLTEKVPSLVIICLSPLVTVLISVCVMLTVLTVITVPIMDEKHYSRMITFDDNETISTYNKEQVSLLYQFKQFNE